MDGARRWTFGEGGAGPQAVVTLRDPHFFLRLATGGHIGAARSYIEGGWDADDLAALVRVFVANREVLDGLERGWARLAWPLRQLGHWRRRNRDVQSRRNIAAHYDLGNALFRLFLDNTLTYSCAFFERPGMTLEGAQIAKIDRIARKIGIGSEDHVLEIGTGWGGFALRAAERFGCRVTTTTISREQHALATRRIRSAGLQDRVTVLLRDYRDLEGVYDKIVSIEMIEAVGHQYYDAFFEQCRRLLHPAGAMAIQAITVPDAHFDTCRREVDFIKAFVFPGSCIPSMGALRTAASRRTDLTLVDREDITAHYVETLRRWRRNFERNAPALRALGTSQEFRRLWRFYLAYCEGGFAEAFTGCVQTVWAGPAYAGSR